MDFQSPFPDILILAVGAAEVADAVVVYKIITLKLSRHLPFSQDSTLEGLRACVTILKVVLAFIQRDHPIRKSVVWSSHTKYLTFHV